MGFRISLGNGGWCRFQTSDLPDLLAYLRFEDVDGRLELRDLFAQSSGEPIRQDHLRRIPIGRIEAMVDADEVFRASMDLLSPDLRTAAAFYGASTAHPGDPHRGAEFPATWVDRMLWSQHPDGDEPTVDLPTPPKPALSDEALLAADLRVRKPIREDGKYPDEFYKDVAQAFKAARSVLAAPAEAIAAANDVPVTTVHRWVKEARRRKLLAPSGYRRFHR